MSPEPYAGAWAPPPAWAPGPVPAGTAPAAPPGAGRSTRTLVLALVAVAGVLAGAVGAAFFVAVAFVSAAEGIGRGMSAGLGGGFAQSMEEGPGPALGGVPVEQFDPVPPEQLGPDPVLDEYAGTCFAGELQACDDLLYESPPLSAYEEYASTCGGRVKQYTVMACTDLD